MHYSKIFNEIVSITQHDYSGWENKQGWDYPKYYVEEITKLENQNEMTPYLFSKIANDYLLAFNDPHLYFTFNGDRHFKIRDCVVLKGNYGSKRF